MILEACLSTIKEAILAQSKGANQIELCDRLDLDGINPPISLVKEVIDAVDIPIKVIVNPNPYKYQYNKEDQSKIIDYIKSLEELNIQGYVFGPITKNGLPDVQLLNKVSSITPRPITFHKAIDSSPDILRAVQILSEKTDISFILSSGGSSTAIEGHQKLIEMDQLLKNSRSKIEIIAAGKITDINLDALHNKVGLTYYHGKKIVGELN